MFEKRFNLKIEPTLPEDMPEFGSHSGNPKRDAEHTRMLRQGWERDEKLYANAVRRDLWAVFNTPVGNILFRALRFHGVTVVVTRYDGSAGPVNAITENTGMDAAGVILPRVRYSPEVFSRETACAVRMPQLARRGQREATVFHELVHALRMISTSKQKQYSYPRTSGGLLHYDDYEEFVAVLSTNIYLSDPGNPKPLSLSADHRTVETLDPGLADSFRFFASSSSTYYYVDRFCKENPWFTRALADRRATFNPLRAYYKDPVKAQAYAQGRYAIERDADGYDDAVMRDITERHRRQP